LTIDKTGRIWRDGAFTTDDWVRLDPDAKVADDTPLLVPYADFVAEPERYTGRNGPLGVAVSAGEAVEALEPHLPRLQLVAVAFPKFSDGRSYSAARILRERYGYDGEIRATGEVLSDQILQMRRCGIDTFDVTHAPTRRALAEGRLALVRRFYQAVPNGMETKPEGTRPWLRLPTDEELPEPKPKAS
jgi:phosphoadenosine phosphosulfate reductase